MRSVDDGRGVAEVDLAHAHGRRSLAMSEHTACPAGGEALASLCVCVILSPRLSLDGAAILKRNQTITTAT